MPTIFIAHEVADDKIPRIEALLQKETEVNPSWNGAVFKVERDDFTRFEGDYSYDTEGLMSLVWSIIEDRDNDVDADF